MRAGPAGGADEGNPYIIGFGRIAVNLGRGRFRLSARETSRSRRV